MHEGADASSPRGPGHRLRTAREARGLAVEDAAKRLRLDPKYLRALEADDFEALPAPIFARGYIAQYCKLLGIPHDECIADYERAIGGASPPPLVVRRGTGDGLTGGSSPLVLVTALVAVLAAAMVVLWYVSRPEPPAPVAPAPRVTPTPAPDVAPAIEPEDVAEEGPEALPDPVVVPPPAVDRTVPAAGAVTVVLQFTEESWTEITDADGRRLYFDLARAGARVEVSGAPPIAVFLGNAPGVRIAVDGRPFDHSRHVRTGNVARFTIQGERR